MATLYQRPCVVIGGPARGGTTLLRDVVASHPAAAILLEERLTDVVRAAERIASIRTPAEEGERGRIFGRATSLLAPRPGDGEALTRLSEVCDFRSRFDAVFHHLFTVTCGIPQPALVGSKLPMFGAWEDVDYLTSRLEDVRLVFVVRNPLDVISSSMVRARNAQAGIDVWPVRTVEAAFDVWLDAMRRMASLRTSAPAPVLVVKYEALCAHPSAECRRLFAFLGLDAEGAAGDGPSPVATAAATPRPSLRRRVAYGPDDAAFLARELGPVDDVWPLLDADAALTAFAARATYVASGDHVALGGHGVGSLLDGGFSFAEPWGRWTDGPEATLRLRHDPRRQDARIELDVALTLDGGAALELQVNGGRPVHALAHAGETLRLDVAADALRPDGVMTVTIRPSAPKAPWDPPAHDPRRLGVGLGAIRFCFVDA